MINFEAWIIYFRNVSCVVCKNIEKLFPRLNLQIEFDDWNLPSFLENLTYYDLVDFTEFWIY